MSLTTLEKSPAELKDSYDCIVMGAGPSDFRVGKFVKEFPHHRGELTDLLIGRVFNDRVGGIFKDLAPLMERMKNELPPEDPNAEPEDADMPALA